MWRSCKHPTIGLLGTVLYCIIMNHSCRWTECCHHVHYQIRHNTKSSIHQHAWVCKITAVIKLNGLEVCHPFSNDWKANQSHSVHKNRGIGVPEERLLPGRLTQLHTVVPINPFMSMCTFCTSTLRAWLHFSRMVTLQIAFWLICNTLSHSVSYFKTIYKS